MSKKEVQGVAKMIYNMFKRISIIFFLILIMFNSGCTINPETDYPNIKTVDFNLFHAPEFIDNQSITWLEINVTNSDTAEIEVVNASIIADFVKDYALNITEVQGSKIIAAGDSAILRIFFTNNRSKNVTRISIIVEKEDNLYITSVEY